MCIIVRIGARSGLAPLGDKGREITVYLIGFVDKMSAGALAHRGPGYAICHRAVVDGQHRRRIQSHLSSARGAHADAQVQRLFERATCRPGVGIRRGDDHSDIAELRFGARVVVP